MITELPNTDDTPAAFATGLTTALDDWNFDDADLANWYDDLSRTRTFTLFVVEDWFARKELDGARVVWGEVEHQTDKAILVDKAEPFTDRNERQSGYYGTHLGETWIPKSVVAFAATVEVEG